MKKWIRHAAVPVAAGIAAAVVFTAPAIAGSAFAVEGLKIKTPVGAFGAIPVGSCDLVTLQGCELKTFEFTNIGTTTIAFDTISLEGGNSAPVFGQPGSGCDFFFALQPGQSCLITVAFSPATKGHVTDELRLISLSEGRLVALVPLSGTGV